MLGSHGCTLRVVSPLRLRPSMSCASAVNMGALGGGDWASDGPAARPGGEGGRCVKGGQPEMTRVRLHPPCVREGPLFLERGGKEMMAGMGRREAWGRRLG